MLHVYALLLLLLVKEISFKNEREKVGFYFIGLGEILSLLPTYPFQGSKFHVVLFQNIFVGLICFSFENGFEARKEAVQALELETSEVSPIYLQKRLKLEINCILI